MMRRLGYYFIFLALLFSMVSIFIPKYYGVPVFKQPGPVLDEEINRGYRNFVSEGKPTFILFGDSYLDTGIDEQYLNSLTKKVNLKIALHGSASAMWYLLLKHNIVAAKFKPPYVIIFFRGTMLTAPEFRTTGIYVTHIDEFAAPDDDILIERAYLNQMNWLEWILDQYFPPYAYRQLERTSIDRMIKYPLPDHLMEKAVSEVDSAMNEAFGDPEIALLNAIINAAEDYLYEPAQLDFDARLPRSFLPEMVRLCKENGIQLVLVRERVLEYPSASQQPDGLDAYTRALESYAKSNNILFIDFAFDSRIKPDFFYDSLHMTEAGQKAFTEILAQALNSLLP